jgi:hypothetical protein
MRDPRVEPKEGDILHFPNRLRPLEIANVDSTVYVWGLDRGRRRRMALCSTFKWPELAKEAKVIHAAE